MCGLVDQALIYYISCVCVCVCRYLDSIESAVSNGDTLLLENISENVEPVLDPLLGRNTIKKGK